MDKQMYNYIVKDAIDDIQDVSDGINELNRIWKGNNPNLPKMIQQLNEMRNYLQSIANRLPEERPPWNPAVTQMRR